MGDPIDSSLPALLSPTHQQTQKALPSKHTLNCPYREQATYYTQQPGGTSALMLCGEAGHNTLCTSTYKKFKSRQHESTMMEVGWPPGE